MATACGGSGSAPDDPWPPDGFGGTILLPGGPESDPQINPVTGRLYDDFPFCDGPMTPVDPEKEIALNAGARVSARKLASWEGSYVCTLSRMDMAGPTVRVDVRLAGGAATCHGTWDGGVLFAPATASLRLTDTDGATPSDISCFDFATVAAWPNGTNLRIDCGSIIVEVREGFVQIDRMPILEIDAFTEIATTARETKTYLAECQPATDAE